MNRTVYRPTDPLHDAARYTTVALVKQALRIPAANTDFDARVLSAVISAELGIDYELGHAFPRLGVLMAAGRYRSTSSQTAPPVAGEYRINAGGTELYLAKDSAEDVDLEAEIETGPPFDEIDDVKAVWLSQPGNVWAMLTVTSTSDSVDYWTLGFTVADGSLSSPAFVADTETDVALLQSAYPSTAIPQPVKQAALSVAHAIYKAGDAPTGTAGSDDFISSLDVAELVRREIARNPLLRGFKTSWGVA